MNTGILPALKEKIDVLEKSLLAIDTLNNIIQEDINRGAPVMSMGNFAYLLNHLVDPALYQVESLKMSIDKLPPQSLLMAA